MNRTFTFMLTGLCLLCLAAGCSKDAGRESGRGTLHLTLGLSGRGGTTRAAYTDSYTDEQTGDCRVFVFDADGALEDSQYISETSSYPLSVDLSLTQGDKTVAAVVNMPSADASSITALSDLRGYRFELSDDLQGSSRRFQMAGETAVTVGDSPVSATVTVKRVAARVVLRSVSNEFVDSRAVRILRIFLTNVAGDWCEGSSSVNTWYNIQGRSDRTQSHIIDGSSYTADLPSLTYESIDEAVSHGASWTGTSYPLYCYPNASTADNSGFTSSFDGEYTALVVAAELGGSSSADYFVVPLDQTTLTQPVESNYTYTVDLTIYGPGTDDPNTPATGLACKASVSVDDWYDGYEYSATFTQ